MCTTSSFLKINFYWSVVALECSVSAVQQGESHLHIYSLVLSFKTIFTYLSIWVLVTVPGSFVMAHGLSSSALAQ